MTQGNQSKIVHPAQRLHGHLKQPPGDKSISHRLAMLAAVAAGESVIHNFLPAEDCVSTLRAMEALGARTFFADDGALHIHGTGGKILEPAGPLDLGNSGTSIRLLAGLLAGFPVTVEMTGDESLRGRPMSRIKEPLEKMGATVDLLGPNNCAPVRIKGGNLQGLEYTLPVASAQVKSCILLAALGAQGDTVVIEPRPTRDHTERLLQALGIPLTVEGLRITLHGLGAKGLPLTARHWTIPGDFSSAAFWLVAAAAQPGANVKIDRVGLNPRRTALLNVLQRMGAHVAVTPQKELGAEPIGAISVQGAALKATTVAHDEIPCLIDELPLVAVAGALAEGDTIIRDAAELRVKETDRIAAMVANLRQLGVEAEEREDGMIVHGPAKLKVAGGVRSYGDHRIAMAMSVLALFAPEPVCINNIACVDTSYPAFWSDLKILGGHAE
ncbi:MAG: 3-phosphoshikimate 1-carboxyvinyltransferase [Kiritimatiellaeota bacterium]|nr:3-phosphoshikimate 1-carboxyvinyltransferase [Kiritimatiellota bacterium]